MMKIMKELEENRQEEKERRRKEEERWIKEEERRRKEEERRLKERQEDKEERISAVKEIREGVQKEMIEVMRPWQERTVRVEESTAAMGEEVRRLAEEMRTMKEQLADRQEGGSNVRSYAGVVGGQGGSTAVLTGANTAPLGGGGVTTLRNVVDQERERVRGMLAHASKVLGLKPIDKRHVEKVSRRLEELEGETGLERQERAKRQAVMEFLKYEMRMKTEDIDELRIVKIFPPAKDEWNVLYVELATKEMAQFAMGFTAYMRRGTTGEDRVEVLKYIPRDLYQRFRAVNSLGNKARIESEKTISYRVTFGLDDLVLQLKPKGRRGWGPPLPLPADLPAVEHHVHLPRGARSPGEAPGRPALTPEQARKRDREGSSPSGVTPPPKKTPEEELADAVLVTEATISPVKPGEGLLAPAPTRGRVTSISSTTPVRPKTRSNKKNNKDE